MSYAHSEGSIMLNQDKFISIVGSTDVIVAADQTPIDQDKRPSIAISVWGESNWPESDIRRQLLSYAILAPNPHNMQPWLVDLRRPGHIILYCDRTRLLPQTDPLSLKLLIGYGTFLDELELAATAAGFQTEITYFPRGSLGYSTQEKLEIRYIDDRPIASIRLIPIPRSENHEISPSTTPS
jgi:hypothetical protein